MKKEVCPVCKADIDVDKISVSIEYQYEHWEYLGLFGGEPASGDTLVGKDKTGKYKCANCDCKIEIAYISNTDDFVITGYKHATRNKS